MEVDDEIKSLAQAMKDLLDAAIKHRDSKQIDNRRTRDIISLVMEGASLMDSWSRKPPLCKYQMLDHS